MFPIQPPVNTDASKASIANLHAILIFLDMKPADAEVKEKLYGDSTRKLILTFQERNQLKETDGFIGTITAAKLNGLVKDKNGFTSDHTISGRIFTSDGVPVPAAFITAYDKGLNGDTALGEATADKEGSYSITYNQIPGGKENADLEVQVLDNRDTKKVIGRSDIRYNAGIEEVINVMVLSNDLPQTSEYDRLVKDLQPHLGTLTLSSLEETKDKQHITYLSNKTGWEPRIVAMAAQASKMAALTKTEPSHVYALFRTGIPSNATALTSLSPAAVETTIKKAAENNIIGAGGDVGATITAFKTQTTQYLLNTVHPTAVSSMSSMLSLRLQPEQQKIFTEVLQEADTDTKKFWSALKEKGFEDATIKQLQLDGKMGYLTGQNAPLIKKVYEKYQVTAEEQLVQRGLYKAAEWKNVIGNDVPKDVTVDDYATQLANEIKFSYPTAVAAAMINNKEIVISQNGAQEEAGRFFSANQSKKLIGKEPVKKWEGYSQLSNEAKAASKTMERLYQMSPSDESMISLSKAGFDSAYQVAWYSKSEFVSKYGSQFPNLAEAELTYTKASEINSASINLATTYLTNRSMPNVYAITGKLQKEANTATIANPTLEELFGNMDYCACDQCKSVLSAAAYLVDLLQFIDLATVPHEKQDPLTTLFKRRPDIQHIQLTCENTNVALPYIDLVNEILEHFIINGDLTTLIGHDITEDTKQSDLLAEPQFVSETAYDELKKKVYPYNLPFHHSLESLRLLFNLWDTTLPDALRIFSTPLSSRKEMLELNEDEYKTVTDRTFKEVPEYFGEAPGTTLAQLNTAIAAGKNFSRCMDISYEDMVWLLKTTFINPGYVLVPLLQKLTISLIDLQAWYDGTLSDGQLDAKIPTTIDPAEYGGDVKQWLKTNQSLIMGLITLTDVTSGSSECNFASVELRYALPDNTKNQLTALSYHKFHRFIRLLKKTGYTIENLDYAITVLLPIPSQNIDETNIDSTFVTLLNRLANVKQAAQLLSLSTKKLPELLVLWDTTIDQSVRETQAAKYFKMSIPDMLDLAQITGLDPLAADLETDEPSFVQWLQLTAALKNVSLKTIDLNYILRNKDLSNKLTPTEATLLTNCKQLRDVLTVVEKENGIAPDNADFSFAKSKMALVYDASVIEVFFGLLTGTSTYSAPFNTIEEGLPKKLTDANARLGFDPFKKTLTYTGIVSAADKTALDAVADTLVIADMGVITTPAELTTFITDFKASLQQIANEGDTDLLAFGVNYPELKTIHDAVKAETDPASQTKVLLNSILPELIARLKNNGLHQLLAALLKTDNETIDVLTANKETLQSVLDNTKPVLNDFLLLEEPITFDQNKTYQFYLDAPATDDYLFYAAGPQNTTITLVVNAQTIINNAVISVTGEVKNNLPLSISTGNLYYCELTIGSLPAAQKVQLSWRTKGMAKTGIPATAIYQQQKIEAAKTSFIRLQKAVSLQRLLKLTPRELGYFASKNSETTAILNNLDTNGTITDPQLHAQWDKLKHIVYFAGVKKENEPEENNWVQILEDPSVKTPQNQLLLEGINLWAEADVTEVLTHFGFNRSDLSKLSVLKKVMQAMQLITTVGYPAALVRTWITASPSYALITSIKQTIKDNSTEAAWMETMPTVSDPLRNKLRDALVNYILHFKKPSPEIITPDKLYEYFLIDVEMDACMKTSRIRQALSTVQLFIQRCLMNLEPDVAPSSIRAQQWLWMKRYRVWEANRKVFLYPENWLEPELRDNKSSFFKELEGELLQAEITDESAELAFLNYLKKLDDVARLEMVGMYLEENEQGNQDDDILHVFGRTNGNTRQYYYRRYEYGYWTAWEKITMNIEGDYIYPVVWKKRLFIFWLNTYEKGGTADTSGISSSATAGSLKVSEAIRPPLRTVNITMSWGEYYKGKWTSPKSSEASNPMLLENIASFNPANFLLYSKKEKPLNKSERLIFNLYYVDNSTIKGWTVTYTSKNAPPIIEVDKSNDDLLQNVAIFNYTLFRSAYQSPAESKLYYNSLLTTGRELKNVINQPANAATSSITESLLTKKDILFDGFRILPMRHKMENQFEGSFVYADERSTFFVQADEEVYTPLRIYDGYYFLDMYKPVKTIDRLPKLIQESIGGWPPVQKTLPGIDKVVNNPWVWNDKTVIKNDNINKVMPAENTFVFGDAVFSSGGKVPDALVQQFKNQQR
jgi:hypothetical protein